MKGTKVFGLVNTKLWEPCKCHWWY